jgi:hypothetical protein
MATCPKCGEYLDTNHQCRDIWRLRLRVWTIVALGGLIGAAAVAAVSSVLYDAVSPLALGVGAVLGSLVTLTYLRGGPP